MLHASFASSQVPQFGIYVSLLLRLAYDGTHYSGFARQAGQRTIQGQLESALSAIYQQAIEVRAASRTDAGVHARGQLVAFDPPFEIPQRGLGLALAKHLPTDASITAIWEEFGPSREAIQPRFGNLGKHYRYRIRCSPLRDPLTHRIEWLIHRPLDLESMQSAANNLLGKHDFRGFRASDCQAKSTIRTLQNVELCEFSNLDSNDNPLFDTSWIDPRIQHRIIEIHVHGDAFLKNMVRVIVGTLVDIGFGRQSESIIPQLLRSGDRQFAGPTAPACGLTLMEVKWPGRDRWGRKLPI